jgi:mannitol/fructose-specific phosphotransferase system IIA component (Ntr-type)
VNLTRFLKEEFIDLKLDEGIDLSPEEGDEELGGRRLEQVKQEVLERLVSLLERSGKVGNPTKLNVDLWNREKKATMALGQGVALPHVRTMQAKELAMAVGVSHAGIPWDAPDGEPVRIFIAMVAPPYEDKFYLQVCQRIGRLFAQEHAAEAILGARSAGEVIRFLARAGE